ncbi:MAG: hypothetical protein AAF602_18305 [Myxococcota bacterium]
MKICFLAMADPRSAFDAAAAFCREVGRRDLLDYLRLPPGVSSDHAREALRERRKYLQGQQGHPRVRAEARAVLSQYAALAAALEDVTNYQADVARRERSAHLPVLELTIRSVLASGRLSPDDDAYLLRNALELGITEADHRAALARIAGEMGVRLPQSPLRRRNDPARVRTGAPARARSSEGTPARVTSRQPMLSRPVPLWVAALGGIVLIGVAVVLAWLV